MSLGEARGSVDSAACPRTLGNERLESRRGFDEERELASRSSPFPARTLEGGTSMVTKRVRLVSAALVLILLSALPSQAEIKTVTFATSRKVGFL